MFRYDAQELPWEDTPTLSEFLESRDELARRWMIARMVAADVSERLGAWLVRWLKAGRDVLLVGFSLGGYLAWRAARFALERVTVEEAARLEVVLLSAAIGDRPDEWEGVDKLGRVVNLYSKEDRVLRYLYPMGVRQAETPAVGLGRICVSDRCALVENVDVTDLIGVDHLWAGMNLDRLLRIALSAKGTSETKFHGAGDAGLFDSGVIHRLSGWVFVDPILWEAFGRALSGDEVARARCVALDAWASEGRRGTLFEVGKVAIVLFEAKGGTRETARRGYRQLYGSIRTWRSETGAPVVDVPESVSLAPPSSIVETALEKVWSTAHSIPVVGSLLP